MVSNVIITNPNGIDIAALQDVSLDLAYGTDENDFTLTFLDRLPPETTFTAGSRAYVEGTEYGGLVDSIETSVTAGATMLTYSGRTWQGVLAAKILAPDVNQDYLKATGALSAALTALIARIGLSDLYVVDPLTSDPTINWQFDRYVDAWSGIRAMLNASGLKMTLTYLHGKVHVNVGPITDWSDTIDSDLLDFTATRDTRHVNHLIGLGTGELRNRAVSHWYADANGKVSQTQTLFGVDEVCATYDYSNAAADELTVETQKKLTELQTQGTVSVSLRDGHTFDLGDVVSARDNISGLRVSATITKKIVKIADGILTVDYEVGQESSQSTSLSGSAESTNQGHAYYAGTGLTLTDYTFAADVTTADLKTVSEAASSAVKSVSDMSASIGALQEADKTHETAIDAAQGTANTAKSTADTAIQKVTASAPLQAAQSGTGVSLAASPATASAAGTMSAQDKAKLDDIEDGANAYTLPTASTTTLGGVKPDGKTITVAADGTITAQTDDVSAAFLSAYPVGAIYTTTNGTNPGTLYGGTWEECPSQGPFIWERTA